MVYRRAATGEAEFLLVTARSPRKEWVFPKGHIEPGESPEAAATREVAEEAGVHAVVVDRLPEIARVVGAESQTIRYFVMRASGTTPATERRETAWLAAPDALTRLTFDDARELLRHALARLDPPEEVR